LIGPAGGLNYFQRVGGGHKHLGKERVRVQGYRGKHLIELLLFKTSFSASCSML
jgi:hypothetical protein